LYSFIQWQNFTSFCVQGILSGTRKGLIRCMETREPKIWIILYEAVGMSIIFNIQPKFVIKLFIGWLQWT
jgi:hypothetical protein